MDPGLWICYCVDHTRLLYEFRWAFVNGFSADFRGFSRNFFAGSDSSGAEAFAGIFHDDLSRGLWNVADDLACGWQQNAALGEGIFDAHNGGVMVAWTLERSKARSQSTISQLMRVRFLQ